MFINLLIYLFINLYMCVYVYIISLKQGYYE